MTHNRNNMHLALKFYVSHIEDDLIALKVSRALADCFPAHALMELVRNEGLPLGLLERAYKNKYSKRKSWAGWTLRGDELAEYEFQRIHDI